MKHDCCKPSYDPFIVGVVVVTILVLIGAIFFGTKIGAGPSVTADTQVALSVDSRQYDWGTIDYDGGTVSKKFNIKNTSNFVLKLYDVKTSCMCTTAQLKTPEATSKKYGMHETSTDVIEVKPKETAHLIVEFDPAFHGPSGVGPVTRIITMKTNDHTNPSLSFTLTGNVVKK